jgi:hypothetical protein
MRYVAIWSLRRGIIDPPELVDVPEAEPEHKPVQSVSIEDLWHQQAREMAEEQRRKPDRRAYYRRYFREYRARKRGVA